MDSFLVSKSEIQSWAARITAAAARPEAQGMAMLIKPAALVAAAAGRLDLIESWLLHIPSDLIESDPKLLYWSGVSALMKRPSEAQPQLERALELFSKDADRNWMLLSWAGIVDSIFFIYRDLRELDPWIEWMTADCEHTVELMPQLPKSLVVSSMLFALAFRQPNHSRMPFWRDLAERLIESNPVSDIGARLAAGLICDYTWHGSLDAAEVVKKRFTARASRTNLSPLATLVGHMNEATLQLHRGELEQCRATVDKGLEASVRYGIRTWDGLLHCHATAASCSLGDIDRADQHLAAIEQLFADNIPVDEAYYRGMLFWRAFVAGDHIGAVSRCSDAISLADVKGVPYLQAVCRIGAALVLFEAGHRQRGRLLLDDGLRIGREIANPLLAWIGGLFQAHMAYACGEDGPADAALETSMLIGRDHSLVHAFFWPRQIITRLIDRALERGYSVDYARRLIKVHTLAPGSVPARSDQWSFGVRIYTFGEPRIEYADGRIEALSVQYKRQIELLAALIGRQGRSTSLRSVAIDVYPNDDVEVLGSIKRVLHSLRARVGPIVVQRHASLELDFSKVWIDACSFQRLRHDSVSAVKSESWLDQYYHGHFMDRVENSEVVLGVRRRFYDQAESDLRIAHSRYQMASDNTALRQFEDRWRLLFPDIFANHCQ